MLSLLAGLPSLAGCSSADADAATVPPPARADTPCAPGELALPDGRCQAAGLPMDMPCAPGELALPDGRCQPAGVPPEACAEGFLPDDARGCTARLPDAPCPPGQMAVPGEASCRAVGACGDGPWGELPVDATTVFVDQAYPGDDSDGSRERPWKTVQEGVRAASSGAIVAVTDGEYAEDVVIARKQVRLWGRCPERVRVIGSVERDAAITLVASQASKSEVRGLDVTGASTGILVDRADLVTIDGVRVHDAAYIGVVMLSSKESALRGSLVEHNGEIGVLMLGSAATVETSVVRETQLDAGGGNGRGVDVQADPLTGERGALTLRASLVEQNHLVGVYVQGSDATIEATVVRDTQADRRGTPGAGIGVESDPVARERGALTLRGSLVERSHTKGVFVSGSDAAIEATVVRDTESDDLAYGVAVEADAHGRGVVTLRTSLIERNQVGVHVKGSDTTLEAVVVRDENGGAEGAGVAVEAAAQAGGRGALTVRASLIEKSRRLGVTINGSDATVETSVVRATQHEPGGATGAGVFVYADPATGGRGALTLRTSLLEENAPISVAVKGSDATIESSVVHDTRRDDLGNGGWGIDVTSAPTAGGRGALTLVGSLVERNHDIGIFLQGSDATIASSVVRDTGLDANGSYGLGIDLQADPTGRDRGAMTLRSSLIERSHWVGVFIAGSTATIEGCAVRDTQPALTEPALGDGIIAMDERGQSTADIAATEVAQNARAGLLFVGSDGTLSGVRASGNLFGLVLQGEVRPTLGDGNAFKDNTQEDTIVGGDLAVPTSQAPLP